MPVPEMIWLKTAKAPRPSAASVDDPANAAPGTSNAIKIAMTVSFFMSVPSGEAMPPTSPSARIRLTVRQNYLVDDLVRLATVRAPALPAQPIDILVDERKSFN